MHIFKDLLVIVIKVEEKSRFYGALFFLFCVL
jgi:hypothetical protein